MDCSMSGFPVRHQLPELAQTHVHRVGDVIQSSHPLSSPSPPAFNLSQHQGLFQSVSSSHQVAKVLELQLQHQSFQRIFSVDFLSDWLVWSPYCPRDSQESCPTPQFKSINSLTLSLLYGPTLIFVHDYWRHHSFEYMDLCYSEWKWMWLKAKSLVYKLFSKGLSATEFPHFRQHLFTAAHTVALNLKLTRILFNHFFKVYIFSIIRSKSLED